MHTALGIRRNRKGFHVDLPKFSDVGLLLLGILISGVGFMREREMKGAIGLGSY